MSALPDTQNTVGVLGFSLASVLGFRLCLLLVCEEIAAYAAPTSLVRVVVQDAILKEGRSGRCVGETHSVIDRIDDDGDSAER